MGVWRPAEPVRARRGGPRESHFGILLRVALDGAIRREKPPWGAPYGTRGLPTVREVGRPELVNSHERVHVKTG